MNISSWKYFFIEDNRRGDQGMYIFLVFSSIDKHTNYLPKKMR